MNDEHHPDGNDGEIAELHQCPECGFHYTDKAQTEKCEAWCKEHKSCNLDITSHAIENKEI